jgi:hypothetical protein
MSEHRQALEKILKICNESSEYTRRTQAIHETAMVALGLTAGQRETRHIKAMMRSEQYKEDRNNRGAGVARRTFIAAVEADTGEPRERCTKQYVKG